MYSRIKGAENMTFIELKIAFSQLGYNLYKDRDYRGYGYFIKKDLDITYIGSNMKEVNSAYLQIKERC